tara:strand:+ start:923 stop:1078 length:156 start_codon:yes stop_codon:yes gene_type:complete
MSTWDYAVKSECIKDIAHIVIDHERGHMSDTEFRRRVIDRIYELDEPGDLL